MKRFVLALITLLCLLSPASFFAATATAAYDPLGKACDASAPAGSSAACNSGSTNPISGPNGVLKKVSIVIATIAGAAAVIVIIISGLRYIFANGDAKKAADARSGIIGAIIGLVIIAAAESIIIFVVSKV